MVLAACGELEEVPGTETTEGTTPETTTTSTLPTREPPMEPPVGQPGDEQVNQVAEEAIGDLSTRLKVNPAEIEILSAQPVTWPDGSLGCPEPGKLYTQALVDGYQVILEHSGKVYMYHAGSDGKPFLCPSEEDDGGHEFYPPPRFDE